MGGNCFFNIISYYNICNNKIMYKIRHLEKDE